MVKKLGLENSICPVRDKSAIVRAELGEFWESSSSVRFIESALR